MPNIFTQIIAVAGLVLNSAPRDIRSLPYVGEGVIKDGDLVAIGADGETCTDVTAESEDFGVVVFQHTGKTGRTADGKAEAYKKHDVLPVMVKGRIWVKPSAIVTTRGRAASVYVTTADGVNKGLLASTGTTKVLGAFWDKPSNSDGLAAIDIGNGVSEPAP